MGDGASITVTHPWSSSEALDICTVLGTLPPLTTVTGPGALQDPPLGCGEGILLARPHDDDGTNKRPVISFAVDRPVTQCTLLMCVGAISCEVLYIYIYICVCVCGCVCLCVYAYL